MSSYGTANSGYGSDDPVYRLSRPRGASHGGMGRGGPRPHAMTLLCHRVDLCDDFVAGRGPPHGEAPAAAGPAPERCFGVQRGCECRAPCAFCHGAAGAGPEGQTAGGAAIAAAPSDLARLFAGRAAAPTPTPPPPSERQGNKAATRTATIHTLVVDPIFAHNHGLQVEGEGVQVQKYHHPPVGRFGFTLPPLELPEFFDAPAVPRQNGSAGGGPPKHAAKKDTGAGLDSFFDDFAVLAPPPPRAAPRPTPPRERPDRAGTVLVFRTPLKTVAAPPPPPAAGGAAGRCYCRRRRDGLAAGAAQPNPHAAVHDKYWAQRRRLFTRFDEGIQLDAEGWYSVTPEAVADHVAARFAAAAAARPARGRGGTVVLDAFCGCGGNGIAFAKLPSSAVALVVCVDLDRSKLRKAAHNASIYGISPHRMLFVEANSVAVMERCYRDGELVTEPPPRAAAATYPPREMYADFTIGGIDMLAAYARRIDAVFIDPPWGGVGYGALGKGGYDVARDLTLRGGDGGAAGTGRGGAAVDGARLLRLAAAATGTRFVAYDLPRNVDRGALARAALEAGYEGHAKLEEHYLNGRLKTVTAYFGQDFRELLDLGGGGG